MAYVIGRGDDVEVERRVLGRVTTVFDDSAVETKRIVQSRVYLRCDQVARQVHCSPLEGASFLPAIARHRSPHFPLSVDRFCCGSIGVVWWGLKGWKEKGAGRNTQQQGAAIVFPDIESRKVFESPGEYELLWAQISCINWILTSLAWCFTFFFFFSFAWKWWCKD